MKVKLHLYWRACDLGGDSGYFTVDEIKHVNKPGKVYLCPIEVDAPEFDKREALIDSLKAEKAVLIRQAAQRAEEIEEKIQQLLALPQDKS